MNVGDYSQSNFRSNSSELPEFISSFRCMIHDKVSFDFDGEAKRSVESIGCKGIF